MIVDKLIEKIIEKQNPTCVGLDTVLEYLPEELTANVHNFAEAAAAIAEFNRKIVDAVCDIVPAVKIQIACYEQYGEAGLKAFRETAEYARRKGLVVIVDAKRNDIGSTAEKYANAYLGATPLGSGGKESVATPFEGDFLTVNGYLGSDGIVPFLGACKQFDRGIFVLVKTSNPSSGELQNLRLQDGRTVFECMGDMVEEWGKDTVGKYGYSAVGAVVGATHPEEAKILRERLAHTFFLIPGYGAQGGNAEMLKNSFRKGGMGGIVNNSRGVLCAYKKRGGTYYEAARQACIDMKQDLLSVLGEICAK